MPSICSTPSRVSATSTSLPSDVCSRRTRWACEGPASAARRLFTRSMVLPLLPVPQGGLHAACASVYSASRARAACVPTGAQARTAIRQPGRSLPAAGARPR
ncbi:hypothetical protein G6F56_014233 [Rhizopus delemar]|nr:hypothetical protein G6F56_014233 [Rhizopus delemar]